MENKTIAVKRTKENENLIIPFLESLGGKSEGLKVKEHNVEYFYIDNVGGGLDILADYTNLILDFIEDNKAEILEIPKDFINYQKNGKS